jgi:beta-N-acetylhexosaminidase
VLAPSADLSVGGGPAELRAFSDDPEEAAQFVRAAVQGWEAAGVLPAPGRFPGEGGASQDPLAGPATVGLSLEELFARDLVPFGVITRTAPAIQMSAALYGAFDSVTPATLLRDAVVLLRRRLRFAGAVVSADLTAAQAATGEGIGRAAIDALMAGCDLLVVPGGRAEQEAAYRAVLTAAQRGRIPRSRLQEALDRVRALKTAAAR